MSGSPIEVQPKLTIVDVQRGGPGNPWETAYIGMNTKLSAFSGGGVSVESQYGRAPDGSVMFLNTVVSSNPERITGSLMVRMNKEKVLNLMKLMDCNTSVRARYKCGDARTITNMEVAIAAFDAIRTSGTFSKDMAVYDGPDAANFERQVDFSAAFERAFKPVSYR